MKRLLWMLLAAAIVGPAAAGEWNGPIIDAHSQVDQHMDLRRIVPVLDAAGVNKVILAARGRVNPYQIAGLADAHPKRIVASVRTKGWPWAKNKPKFYKLLNMQLGMAGFRAMAELILYHAQKGDKAPEWDVAADSPQATAALDAAYSRGWPAVLHYEFAADGSRDSRMAELEGLLAAKPDHPFVLIHMAQLEAKEAGRLLAANGNLHFITSHSNSVTVPKSNQPWVNLFDGPDLKPEWKALITQHPDRFVLGFDNVFADHWGDYYIDQVKLWRGALAGLPDAVAHAVAHGNAERLWKLNPL